MNEYVCRHRHWQRQAMLSKHSEYWRALCYTIVVMWRLCTSWLISWHYSTDILR